MVVEMQMVVVVVDLCQLPLADAARHLFHGGHVVAEVVDGENAVDDEVSGRVHEGGEHQAGAVAQHHIVAQMDGLEVLGLTRGDTNVDLDVGGHGGGGSGGIRQLSMMYAPH